MPDRRAERKQSNIEIKARAADFSRQFSVAQEKFGSPAETFRQVDTFFRVPEGRLKLREFDDGTAELIFYRRPDQRGPRRSDYRLLRVSRPEELKELLRDALGVVGVVRKVRTVFLSENIRIHFDRVEKLGEFIEIEAVLDGGQTAESGKQIVRRTMEMLGISREELVSHAYIDLLLNEAGP